MNNGRRRLPDERQSITHRFNVGDQRGYLTVGLYEDGSPGEIFVTIAKQGSTVSGLTDAVATMMSLALQYGVPLDQMCRKLRYTQYDPSGLTRNPDIPTATSLMDYIAGWLQNRFGQNGALPQEEVTDERHTVDNLDYSHVDRLGLPVPLAPVPLVKVPIRGVTMSGTTCPDCGRMVRHEERCLNCVCGWSRC